MAGNIAPNIVDNGLVLYLDAANIKSYPTTGATWTDLSKSGYTGTLTNGPTFNSNNGGSIVFDGVNDYVQTNFQTDPTTMTFEYWVSYRNVSSTFVVAGKIQNGNYWSGIWSDQTIVFSMNNSVMSSGVVPALNSYYHVACQFTPTSRLIYVNGELKNSAALVGTTSPSGSLTLGNFNNTFYAPINLSLFRFYSRTLTQTEILQNYNTNKNRYI